MYDLPRLIMHRILTALLAAMSTVGGFAYAQAPPAAGAQLFSYVAAADLSDAQSQQLDTYRSDPTARDVRITQVQMDLLKQADSITLNLFTGADIPLDQVRVEARSDTDYSWFATDAPTGNSATFVVDGDQIVGTIHAGSELYRIRPLSNGLHALILVDTGAFPPDHPPEFEQEMRATPPGPSGQLRQQSLASAADVQDTGAVITVLVAYTNAARLQAGNINSLIQLAIDETNQSYANSRVNPRLNLVHRYQTNYTESGNMRLDRDRFRIRNDGFMDEVHGRRNTYRADVAILITASGGACGIAAAILANQDTAFAVVGQNCATGYYSFGHEIGHLQGARHDPAADPSTAPFPYGHGFCYTSGNWRTVMSYNNNCRNRRQNWSNPSVRLGGVATGTSATHNNARVLNNTAPLLANFRVTQAVPCRSGFVPAGSRLCISQNAHAARSYANAMTYCRDRRSRVASYGDLRYLYVRSGLDAAYNPSGRWIGNFVDDDRALCGNRSITFDNDPDIANFEGRCSRFDNRSFWCAHDR